MDVSGEAVVEVKQINVIINWKLLGLREWIVKFVLKLLAFLQCLVTPFQVFEFTRWKMSKMMLATSIDTKNFEKFMSILGLGFALIDKVSALLVWMSVAMVRIPIKIKAVEWDLEFPM
jgi:hypothetical protein